MNKKLLLALQKRNNERLGVLRTKVEDPELRAADLPAIELEIEENESAGSSGSTALPQGTDGRNQQRPGSAWEKAV